MIEGKVAAILDERTLAINVGSNAGVSEGMRFMIFDAKGKKIIDPDTKKELGDFRIRKRAVRILEVSPTYSVAETYKFKTINEGGTSNVFGNIGGYLSPPKYVKKYETFAIEEEDKRAIDEERSLVKVGDIVEQIHEEEEEVV
ncbi:hypothetical protein A3F64_03120 [Candidatus Saccharibacteria bacterium RIFCSPHIGHO2_12_FULL_42_8]|nr:MAG: hypothetical protein A3F64_03120 [Candidatus Saccharibacteria bacterium RIFCSPHIGHO2_12_FULL_42_8]